MVFEKVKVFRIIEGRVMRIRSGDYCPDRTYGNNSRCAIISHRMATEPFRKAFDGVFINCDPIEMIDWHPTPLWSCCVMCHFTDYNRVAEIILLAEGYVCNIVLSVALHYLSFDVAMKTWTDFEAEVVWAIQFQVSYGSDNPRSGIVFQEAVKPL